MGGQVYLLGYAAPGAAEQVEQWMADASVVLVDIRLAARSRWLRQVIAHPGVTSLTFEQAVLAFIQGKEANGRSRIAIHDYKTVVNIFLRYMADKHNYKLIADITERDILVGQLPSLVRL
ncbi:hypothetical protein [Ktedonobacter racemifer]|uniref:hypothetical protein n=1 Tax=Ktedonobacter racemifer TaxID=363277 RepID=UPI00058FEE5A|nr:hypothetical protein [Ktedonobacter racemifer]